MAYVYTPLLDPMMSVEYGPHEDIILMWLHTQWQRKIGLRPREYSSLIFCDEGRDDNDGYFL